MPKNINALQRTSEEHLACKTRQDRSHGQRPLTSKTVRRYLNVTLGAAIQGEMSGKKRNIEPDVHDWCKFATLGDNLVTGTHYVFSEPFHTVMFDSEPQRM